MIARVASMGLTSWAELTAQTKPAKKRTSQSTFTGAPFEKHSAAFRNRVTVPNRQTHRLREPHWLLAKGNGIRLKKSSVSREAEPFSAERFEDGLPYTSDPNRLRK